MHGYPTVDSKNQIDMVEAEQVIRFCEMVEAKREDKLSVMEVTHSGRLIEYDLQTSDGKVNVVSKHFVYENGKLQKVFTGNYMADDWAYSENGYLMFSGVYFSEEQYVLTLSDAEEYVALRAQPLDETCRELNRKYLLSIGYAWNNMFLVDWSEEDFGNLNFYDLYDIFYQNIYERHVPYVPDENPDSGAVYRIPKAEFEHIIMSYFNIDGKTLQTKTTYDSEDAIYEYKPRGFYEVEYPEYPYPEVVAYTENENGTITLAVNVVFPYAGISKVYAHEVVVRPLDDGTVRYVSNRIIPSQNNYEVTWHTPRLTEDEWTELYNATEEMTDVWEKGYGLPIDEKERKEAQDDSNSVLQLTSELYMQADKGEASNVVLSDSTLLAMQQKIKESGYPVTTVVAYSNMENYESIDYFLRECMHGKSGSVVVYEIHSDGGLGRMKYIFDGTDMYVLSARTAWNQENKQVIEYISYTRIKEWKYTDKGWFCYELCVPEPPEVSEVMDGSCLIRVKPLSEEKREMSEKYVKGLGYKGNNILCSNLDAENMEELDYNGMYEYLYSMKYQEKFNAENYPNGIPKEDFESLIMEYLPVTVEQIREYAVFDEENRSYAYASLGCFHYAPTFFGTSLPEVTDIKEKEDGMITLTVDAVCDMVICDDAVITHELTVRLAEDGSFQYLGNKILNDGIKDIPDYQYRMNG